jgi:DNA polymerase-3 subunit epsilon
MAVKKLFYDLETTGLDKRKNGIHQLAGCVEINGEVVEYFDIKMRPNPKAIVDPQALKISGITEEDLLLYDSMEKGFKSFKELLSRYIDPYSKTDKFFLVGYNNRSFDDKFLRAWFLQNKDEFFGSWFYADSLDVLVLASQYLIERRPKMANFKQLSVAKELGIFINDDRLHDAEYDIWVTRSIYRIVTSLEMEL